MVKIKYLTSLAKLCQTCQPLEQVLIKRNQDSIGHNHHHRGTVRGRTKNSFTTENHATHGLCIIPMLITFSPKKEKDINMKKHKERSEKNPHLYINTRNT